MGIEHIGGIQNEWYTPKEIADLVHEVFGKIDLDPASCEEANKFVRAEVFHTKENSGLEKSWHGRVFLNPPFEGALIKRFATKLSAEYLSGRTTEAIFLTHNCTDSAWWHSVAGVSSAVLFIKRRVHFWNPSVQKNAPARGQTICYLGISPKKFIEKFSHMGLIMLPPKKGSMFDNAI